MVVADVLEAADCEQVLLVRDRSADAMALVAVHDTRLGPAHGGIRRLQYASLHAAARDVVALAQAMTWKCALAEVPAGGGKCVLLDRPGFDRRAAYRLVGRTVQQLGGRFFTGPDVGTSDDDLREVAAVTKFVAVAPAPGQPGPGDLAKATALGVFAALTALAERLGRPLAGLHVAIQGLGAVGLELARCLRAAGARLSVADVMPERVAAAVALGAEAVASDRILQLPCDVFAPCALGGVLTAAVAASLPARGVCGAANNLFADDSPADRDAPSVLHRRGVLVVPDFVANAGALIQGATWHRTGVQVGPERLARIGITAGELLDRSRTADVPPSTLALQLARERLARASA
jgi:leucine dehydrogenase